MTQPSNPAEQEHVLTELRRLLFGHYGERLHDLVLFGSRARGDAAPDSDYDVLVVLTGDVDPIEEREAVGDALYRVCWELDVVISSHFVPLSRFRAERSPFMMNVRAEGVAL